MASPLLKLAPIALACLAACGKDDTSKPERLKLADKDIDLGEYLIPLNPVHRGAR
jgi:hypothetical protein